MARAILRTIWLYYLAMFTFTVQLLKDLYNNDNGLSGVALTAPRDSMLNKIVLMIIMLYRL